jgi:hypothetical protein
MEEAENSISSCAGLIRAFASLGGERAQGVDARNKCGHDGVWEGAHARPA